MFRSNYNTRALVKEISRSKVVNILLNLMVLPLVWVLAILVSGQTLSVGLFTAIIGAVLVLSKLLSGQLSDLFLNLATHRGYAKDLHGFANLAENKDVHTKVEMPPFETLTIKNLYFRYNEDDDYILKGINLDLKKGFSYSLVGINGAGKTTLTKIITGLYRTYEGEILLNGEISESTLMVNCGKSFLWFHRTLQGIVFPLKTILYLGNQTGISVP